MRLHPATLALGDHCRALGDQRPRRDRQDTTQALEGVRRTEQRRLQRNAMGCIIEAVFCDAKAPALRLNGFRRGECIAHHQPVFLAPVGPTQGQMDRPIPLLCQGHRPPDERLPSRPGEPIDVAGTRAVAIHPPTPVDPNPPVPPPPCQRCHARRAGTTTLGGQDDCATPGQPRSDLLQARWVDVIGHTAPGGFQEAPHQRNGPAPIDDRDPHETVRVPTPGRSQGSIPAMSAPLGEGVLDQRTIEGMDGYPCMLEPAGNPTPGARRTCGSAVHRRYPGRRTDWARRSAACHHAGQGLEMATIHPVLMWASHLPQRLIETRRAFPVYPPWKMVVPKSV